MNVLNIHELELHANPSEVGTLIDSLASSQDVLWPNDTWPRMKFDRPLAVGATGGHGPIRYFVEEYKPSQSIKFRFTGPKGFEGYHSYETISLKNEMTLLRHTLKMTTHGRAVVSWPFIFRPMHDALLEDSLATAQASLGITADVKPWSYWVRMLRWLFSGGKSRSQTTPNMRLNASHSRGKPCGADSLRH